MLAKRSIFLLILSLIFHSSLVSSSQDALSKDINSLFSDLRTYSKARELLLKNEGRDLLTLLPNSQDLSNLVKFVPKSQLFSEPSISVTSFITLKPLNNLIHPSNLGILFAYKNGILELREIIGTLLYKLDLGYEARLLATTNSYDDIKFAVINGKSHLQIFSVIIDKPSKPLTIEEIGLQSTKVFISIYKESEIELEDEVTSLMFYIRSGKKYWVTGDVNGGLTFITLAGIKEIHPLLNSGPVLAIDRFGPQILVSTNKATGVLNMNNYELQSPCFIGGPSMTLDALNMSSIVHVAYENEVYILDTRTVSAEQFVCKEIKKISRQAERIISTKDSIILWNLGIATFLHPTNYQFINEVEVCKKKESSGMSTFRNAAGTVFIAFHCLNEAYVYEYVQSKNSGLMNDFSSVRYIVVILIVLALGYWQYTKARKPKVSKEKKNN